MANTLNRYTGDGSTLSFAVTFEQYSWTSIVVLVDNVEQTAGYTYNTLTKAVVFATAPYAGAKITIKRVSDVDLLYKFGEGAAFTGANLDSNFEQYQTAVEEVQNAADLTYVQDALDAEEAARIVADQSLQAQIQAASPLLDGEVGTLLMQKRTITNSATVPTGMNAFSVGPQIIIAPGQQIDLEGDATWAVLGNAFEMDALYNVTANKLTTSDASFNIDVVNIAAQDATDAALALKADLASPALTGTPTAPTAAAGTNTTQLATTAFVAALGALKANLASPTFTGTPAAPTATAGTSTTQIATTEFVTAADNLKANLASPTFTGTPTAPTAAAGTSTTQLATTAFVAAAAALKADIASPTFTGTVTIPTLAVANPVPLAGVVDGSSAAAGKIGEVLSNSATAVAQTSNSNSAVTSVSLTAGEWDVCGSITYNVGAGNSPTVLALGINTANSFPSGANTANIYRLPFSAGASQQLGTPMVRLRVSTTTTVYLVTTPTFSGGTLTCDGVITARRVR